MKSEGLIPFGFSPGNIQSNWQMSQEHTARNVDEFTIGIVLADYWCR